VTFRVQPAVITRICDGCRTESDPVDLLVLREQGWTLAPGGPYSHPVPALDWCPNCTTIRSDLAAAIALVRERAELRFGIPAVQGTYQAGYAAAMDDILRALKGDSDE